MAPSSRHRGHGEDSIYFDASKNRWVGATSVGFSADGARRIRHKVRGRTKAEVRDKLQALHRELEVGVHTSATYTVAQCIQDWLKEAVASQADSGSRTVMRDIPVTAAIASRALDLTAASGSG